MTIMPRAEPANKIRTMLGQTFGRLTVNSEAPQNRHGQRRWKCACSCGGETTVIQGELRSGGTRSCGCLRDEVAAAKATHGHARRDAHTSEYQTWQSVLKRCDSPTSTRYPAYGGRGIKMCAGWHVFASFATDMGPRPSSTHSIDRMDNERGYDCGHCADCVTRGAVANCRWATATEQARNRRNTVRVEHNGRSVALVEVARESGVSYSALYDRIVRQKQDIVVALGALMKREQTIRTSSTLPLAVK